MANHKYAPSRNFESEEYIRANKISILVVDPIMRLAESGLSGLDTIMQIYWACNNLYKAGLHKSMYDILEVLCILLGDDDDEDLAPYFKECADKNDLLREVILEFDDIIPCLVYEVLGDENEEDIEYLAEHGFYNAPRL